MRSLSDEQPEATYGGRHVSGQHPDPRPPSPRRADRLHPAPNEYAGRLDEFRQSVFAHLVGMEQAKPTRLRLLLAAETRPEGVRELLVREQPSESAT
jgi:hypothetical protein